MTPYMEHVNRWNGCTACDLCHTRKRVVMARGNVPADVVFIGEAPGQSEDVLGRPFVGPAGRLLDDIIEQSIGAVNRHLLQEKRRPLTYALTNLVSCIPLDPEDRTKLAQPETESIKACRPRLVEFVRLCQPRMIVLVGSLARDYIYGQSMFSLSGNSASAKLNAQSSDYTPEWIPASESLKIIDIVHPAAILRANLAQRGLSVRRCVVTISNAVQETFVR